MQRQTCATVGDQLQTGALEWLAFQYLLSIYLSIPVYFDVKSVNVCWSAAFLSKSISFNRHIFVVIIKALNVHQFSCVSAGHLSLSLSLSKSRGTDASRCDYDIINTGRSPLHNTNGFSVASARESAELWSHNRLCSVFKACPGMWNPV